MSRRWRNWCQNEVYEETKEADSRDKVKHNGRSDQLFLEMMMKLVENGESTEKGRVTSKIGGKWGKVTLGSG